MRESFGGTFMIQLSLVFLVIYISFMAVAINYAKTFRIKNGIINIIEQHGGVVDGATVKKIENYLDRVGYKVTGLEDEKKACEKKGTDGQFLDEYGVCIRPSGDKNDPYYVVYTYISIDFPFFDIRMKLKVSGETETFSDWRK